MYNESFSSNKNITQCSKAPKVSAIDLNLLLVIYTKCAVFILFWMYEKDLPLIFLSPIFPKQELKILAFNF